MTESRVTKSWIEATMAEADAQYAAAQQSMDIYRSPRAVTSEASETAAPVTQPHDMALPRPYRRTGWRRAVYRTFRATSFMVLGAAAMLGIITALGKAPTHAAATPQALQDPLAMLASIAPRFHSGEVVLSDQVAFDALEGQLDIIREGALATLVGQTDVSPTGILTRVYGGVFEVPYQGAVLIGPPEAEPSLISFNRSEDGLFGGYLNGAFTTMRVGDPLALSDELPAGCTLALAALQAEQSATFLLRCR